MPKHYTIYCDESLEKGEYYSDFYGGLLVETQNIEVLSDRLLRKKEELNLYAELKWSKVSAPYLQKYMDMIDLFFSMILNERIKIRIMFRQSAIQAKGLSEYNKRNGYFLLYYQFIKHSFGLPHAPEIDEETYIRILFDELPDSKHKSNLFKSHIYDLQQTKDFKSNQIKIRRRDIGEVDSKKHVLLQCLDIVLGSMAFRLNDKHKIIPEGASRRGKKTIAKEKLYKRINKNIRIIYPNFNIGISTGIRDNASNVFIDPYRHWSFRPQEFIVDEEKFK